MRDRLSTQGVGHGLDERGFEGMGGVGWMGTILSMRNDL